MKKNRKKISAKWFLKAFSKTIDVPGQKPQKPVILVSAGPSRVGKTTVLKFIQKRLPYFVRIAHDDMRLFLYRRGFPASATVENFIYESFASYRLAEDFLKHGYGVIIDDNLASWPKKFEKTRSLAKKFKTNFFVIRIWAPAGVARKRLVGKKTPLFPDWRIGIEHFERSRKQFDYKKFDKLYSARINTALPLGPQLRPLLRTLQGAMGS